MGVIEATVHSKSLGTFMSTNSMHSAERSRSLVIENGEVGLLKYKRRKVSAFRDFPPGCGEASSQVHLRPGEEVSGSVTADVFAGVHPDVSRNSDVYVRGDSTPCGGPVSPQINLSHVEDAACVFSTEDLQGGLHEFPRNLEMCVSRNYSLHCGPVSPRIPAEDAAFVVGTEDLQGGLLEDTGNFNEPVARDCALGRGPVSPQINVSPAEDAACVVCTEDLQEGLLVDTKNSDEPVARDSAPGQGPVSPQINLSPAEDATCDVCPNDLHVEFLEVTRNSDGPVARDCAPVRGPVSPQVNLSPAEDAACAGIQDNLKDGLPEVPRNSDELVARDCTPGCGTKSPQVNLSPAEDAACAGIQDNLKDGLPEVPRNSDELVARDCTPGCGTKSPQIILSPGEDATRSGSIVDLQHGLSDVPRSLDVHFARDVFPSCTPVFPKLNLRAGEDAKCASTTENPLGRILEVPKILDVDVATSVVESMAELQPTSTCQEDGRKLTEVELLNDKAGKLLESSKVSTFIDHGKSKEHNIYTLSKDLHETYVPTHEVVDRKFPPRRRVSAVRDFPPFCGRDAPLLSKQESVKMNEMNLDQVSRFDQKASVEISKKNAKKMGESYLRDRANNEFIENDSKLNVDKVQADYKAQTSKEREMKDEPEMGAEVRGEKFDKASVNNANQFICKSDRDANKLRDSLSIKKKLSDQYVYQSQGKMNSSVGSKISSDRVIVQALMASSNCPWRKGKSLKKESRTSQKIKMKKDFDSKISIEKSKMKSNANRGGTSKRIILNEAMLEHVNFFPTKKYKGTASAAHGGSDRPLIQDEDMLEHDNIGLHNPGGPSNYDVSLTRGRSNRSGKALNNDATDPRRKVRETLRLFQAVCRRLLQEEEGRSKKGGNSNKRVDLQAAKILKDKGKYVNEGKQIMGSVPGVEVGDEFRYRVELNIIGLHRQIQGGIDYVKHAGKILATSIVASGGYSDDLECSNALIYTGQGGNVMNSGKEPEDQKLERGNLAMKNSFDEKNFVRVIRGSEISEGRTYVYDGLYVVKKWWQDMGPHGKLVFKFLLDRIPNQPELAWKELRKSTKLKVREGLCIDDISQGKESCPINAMNTIDDEKPPPFTYITRNIYPDWFRPIPPKGCDCSNGCSDSERCSCAVKNGGDIPYNHNEVIVEAKSLVYECGPKCRCPPSCCNRVSQKGIKFRLEIFKTESRGWGVRSLNSIPSGSFICEYIGEVIDEKEAEQRSNDEYLFDIGNNYNDSSLRDELSTLMPHAQPSPAEVIAEGNFTIDASKCGNVGRFINHCCFPNLNVQNVLYDYEDKRIPHVMLFAAENIPPLQELTYHYNYTIDQVHDPNGNIKKKSCYCGSVKCTGRMY